MVRTNHHLFITFELVASGYGFYSLIVPFEVRFICAVRLCSGIQDKSGPCDLFFEGSRGAFLCFYNRISIFPISCRQDFAMVTLFPRNARFTKTIVPTAAIAPIT